MKISSLIFTVFTFFLFTTSCKKEDTVNPGITWKTLTPMPTARYNFGFVECNGLLYAIGGYNANGLNKVEVYNPANDTWKAKTSMPTARGYLVVASVANKIYAIGGITGGDLNNITYTNVTEEYDPAKDTWTVKSPFPIAANPPNSVLGNQFITGSAINGKIYVVVGTSGGNEPTYIYNPNNDTWNNSGKTIAKFNLEPYFSTSSNNDMYVTDGDNFLQYISPDNEWRVWQPYSIPRKGACLSASDDNIYSIGGYNVVLGSSNNYVVSTSNDVEVYNTTKSSWVKTASLNAKRHSAGAVNYNGNLYVVGGADKQSNFTDIPLSGLEVLPLK